MPGDDDKKATFDSLARKARFERQSLNQLTNYDLKGANQKQLNFLLGETNKAYNAYKVIDEQICEIDPNQSKMEDVEKQYRQLQLKLLSIVPEDQDTDNTDIKQQLNETIITLSEHQKELIDAIRGQATSSTPKDKVRLPPIDIPFFWGKRAEEFQSFKDLFISIVHNNESISNCEKLSYLKRFLKGDAYTSIRHVLITDANYEETWNKVVKRYDNPIQVVTAFTKRFIDQATVPQNSTTALRKLFDISSEVISGLKALGPLAESRDVWLNYLILTKLDTDSRNEWAKKTVDVHYPTLDSLLEFLERRCTSLENCEANQKRTFPIKSTQNLKAMHAVTRPSSQKHDYQAKAKPAAIQPSRPSPTCKMCGNDHYIHECPEYNALDIIKRKEFIAENRVCFNCLGGGHNSRNCLSRKRCFVCHRKHHTTIHSSEEGSMTQQSSSLEPQSDDASHETTNIQTNISLFSSPLLPTARVIVKDDDGKSVYCRMLLDSGSNGTLVSESLVQKLNLRRQNARFPVKGIASKATTKGATTFKISPYFQPDVDFEIKAFIMDHLASNLPKADPNLLEEWNILNSLPLADPIDGSNNDIDLVLGVGYFLKSIREGQHEGPSELVCQNTLFGWIIGGGEDFLPGHSSFNVQLDFNIDRTLQKFWELEELPSTNHRTPDDHNCEELFESSTYRNEEGRFVVKLPFIPNSLKLGNSLSQAVSRFTSIERKLAAQPALKAEYVKFMREYQELNHMEELSPADLRLPESQHFYLPHHAVVKENNITTKVRVVFDGSAKTSTSVSLNNNLLVGPTVQPDLLTTIMRFRMNPVAFTSDIEKMYRQIRINADDANFQRIVWRESPKDRLKHFKLTTVTYGTTSAPFLATRSLQQLAKDCEESNPRISYIISNDFYVDDVLSGAKSFGEAIEIAKELVNTLGSAGFKLQKWASNSKEFLTEMASTNMLHVIDISKGNEHKVLGLHWVPETDSFKFRVNMVYDSSENLTKRELLSDSSRLFDPLGWLSPVIISIKILFQQLWLIKLDWDDVLPTDVIKKWKTIQAEIKQLENLTIPRYLNLQRVDIELHGFCDASRRAFAAAVYLRATDEFGQTSVNLIAAKTKVAPIATITIPRAELCAAHLLAKLTKLIIENLRLESVTSHSWTDSEIVIHWLAKHPSTWKTFIANRTSEIQKLIPQSLWHHVSTKSNAADCASRGIMPSELLEHRLWWTGPEWLQKTREHWPIKSVSKFLGDPSTLEQNKSIENNQAEVAIHPVGLLFTDISSFSKIKRILAYCFRFYWSCKIKTNMRRTLQPIENVPPITRTEFLMADVFCYRWAQEEDFHDEIKLLDAGKQITHSCLLSSRPFLDTYHVLRVGGRLQNSACAESTKHPVILPKNHVLSKSILSNLHKSYLHPTSSTLFHISRQSFWIVSGRILARKITNSCLLCFKIRSAPKPQLMGDLPAVRTTPSRPFSKTGVDFAGPVYIASKRGRGAKLTKAYVAVFVCMVTKAVHLELVSDLSTNAFIAAVRRFSSRRGVPTDIYSDNGTNFKGACRKLSELEKTLANHDWSQIQEDLAIRGSRWHFIPPVSPSFGGLWEASVKQMKHHLLRATANVNLTFEENSTLLCQIEAILNSRPLTPISMDPQDETALTPAHFLLLEPIGALPDDIVEEIPDNRLDHWQRIQKRVQGFWSRFSKEYLHTLQQRQKWNVLHENLAVGDLVYIKDELLPPLHWPLGRIVEVHPGKDNIVRVASVKTSNSIFRRPISKLIKLPDHQMNE